MSDLIERRRRTYHATTPRKINTISTGQTVLHTAAPTVVYRNPDGPAAADEIERLTAELERRKYDGVHTCWDECPRLACAQRREIDALRAQLAEARGAERAADADPVRAADYRDLNILRDKLRDYVPLADSDGDDGA